MVTIMVTVFEGDLEWAMLHRTSRERYDKLTKVFRRLMRNFNVDDLEDFILIVNSMPVWMKNDASLVREQRDAIARFRVEESLDWQICHQIANQQKHVQPQNHGRRSVPRVGQPQINPGGRGILLQSTRSARVIGAGEEISVDYSGTQESALAFVIRTFKHFHFMFEMAPIPPAQRQIPTLADLVGV
jgi:hypothetical protein